MVLGISLFAQNKEDSIKVRPLNGINLNVLGDASIFGVNYERYFPISSRFILSGKVGLGYNQEVQFCLFGSCASGRPEQYLTIPHHITANIGKGRKLFELGLGGTVFKGKTTYPYLVYGILGYRALPLKSDEAGFRLFLQFALSGLVTDSYLFSPIGFNLGKSF
jgi:hypothetical protein